MFSVIMPVYNNRHTLDAAVRSVLGQTVSDLELIIVDDGSTDGSYEKSAELAEKDRRIRVFQNPHGGVSAARNRGIDEATGDILLFLDSDDYWEPDLLESAGEIGHGTYKLFGFKTNRRNSVGELQDITDEFHEEGERHYILDKMPLCELFRYNIASPGNKFFEKKIIDEHHIRFNTACVYLEDLTFNLEYLQYCTSVEVLFRNLYHYYVNVDKKQILKRHFKIPFENADALFFAAKAFLEGSGKGFGDANSLSGTVMGAYCREALSWIYEKSGKEAKEYLRRLNGNPNFRYLLTLHGGKFMKLLRVAVRCNLLSVEKKMLQKRYW